MVPWETPAPEVFKVAYAVQALGLGAAPRSDLMATGLDWHCPVCWAGSAPGLPHLNHAPTQCPVPRSFPYAMLLFSVHVINEETSPFSE